MFSAYDIKKIIPRAVFALVAINLSWALMDIFIQAVDTLGASIYNIILAPFDGVLTSVDLSGTSNTFSAVLTLAIAASIATAGLGLIPIAGVAAAGATGILLAFVIVMVRRVALIGLVLIAPVAIAAGVLHQTESWFKKWWDWFSKLLLMYPFIMAFFALSRIASGIISQGGDAGLPGMLYQIAAVAVLIAPYFLIGKAFSLAGGTIGKLAGVVNNRDKGLIDKTKKWDAGRVAKNRSDAKAGSRYGGRNVFTRGINRTLRDGATVHKTAFRGQAKRDAEIIAANERAAAALEELSPGIKGATKEEIKIGALAPNESAAKAAVERLVADDMHNGMSEDAARAKWGAALAGWKAKAGTLDSASATWALKKATEGGLITPGEAQRTTSLIGQNLGMRGIIGEDGEAGRIGGAMNSGLEASLRASGSAFGYGQTASTPAVLSTLNPADRATLTGAVDGIFEGEKQMSFEALGKINTESAATIRTVKQQQVNNVIAGFAGGVVTQEQAEEQLKEHRKHALLMAQSAANEKNAAAATEAAALLAGIDAAMAAHNTPPGGGPAPALTIDEWEVADRSHREARARAKPL